MGRTALAVALLIILLVGAIGLAGWVYAHRGYPNVVYYQQAEVTTSFGRTRYLLRVWIDPQAIRELADAQGRRFIVRDGRMYGRSGTTWHSGPLGSAVWTQTARGFHAYLNGGFGGAGRALLAQAIGPVRHAAFSGRQALTFIVTSQGERQTVWVDARTLVPIQTVIHAGGQGLPGVTDSYTMLKRYPPGTLPADLFDPPDPHPTLADDVLSWARQHLGGPRQP